MPLFLRALPLSIATLWHYVFLLPLVLIVCLPFLLLTLIPLLGLAVMVTISTFITFAGFRCALAAFGQGNEPSFVKLIRSSLSWGVINLLSCTVLMIVAFGIGRGLLFLGFSDTLPIPIIFAVPYAGGLAATAYLVLFLVYNAAVAVPMTSVAHAATTRRHDPGILFGLGGGLVSLLIVSSASIFGLVSLGFLGTFLEGIAKGLAIVTAKVMGVDLEEAIEIDWIQLAIAVIYLLWCTCWFCATAVLAWDLKLKQRVEVAETVIAQAPRISADDLRALREARMPGNKREEV